MSAVYDRIGVGYADLRRPDARIAAAVSSALGDARTVVNVGAGAGSYEPPTTVLAVEPSTYWRQPEAHLAPAVREAISTFALLPPDVLQPGLARLGSDLADGTWQARYGGLLDLDELDCGYRLVILG